MREPFESGTGDVVPLGAVDEPPAHDVSQGRARHTILVTCTMLAYQGFTMAINGVGAPWIAKSFELSQSGIAALFAGGGMARCPAAMRRRPRPSSTGWTAISCPSSRMRTSLAVLWTSTILRRVALGTL